MKRRFLHIFALIVLLGCEESTDWDLQTTPTELLVVEAQITNELRSHTVRLSKTVEDLNTQPERVSGAIVAVGTGDQVFFFVELVEGSGVYFSDSVQAVVDRSYQLYIRIGEQEYHATTQMVPVEPLRPLDYRLVDEENGLYELNFQDSNDASKKEYWISWGHLPAYEGQPLTETLARTYHYTVNTVDVNQLFKPDRDPIRFPVGSIVLRRKYSMSEDQQAFYRTFLSETQWRGGPFDIQKGNVVTNLSEGAVGYFAVSTVVSDTTLILP